MGCFSIERRQGIRAQKAGERLVIPPQQSAHSPSYRPDIDGLRALAILSVVLYHGGLIRISGGFTGVDIFFVISGYLIGGQICAQIRAGTFSFTGFYRRRAKRILPAFFAVLVFVLTAGLVLLSPNDLTRLARSACAAAVSVSNILFWHSASYFDTRSDLNPLLMTWSLGVEEQFYAVIPLLLVLVFRIRRNRIVSAVLIVSALSFLFSWIALAGHPALVFYMLPARAWELGIGVARAGRSTPGIVPRTIFAVAIAAPVLPAVTNPAAFPACTSFNPTRIELSCFLRTACAAFSSMPIRSVALWITIGRSSFSSCSSRRSRSSGSGPMRWTRTGRV